MSFLWSKDVYIHIFGPNKIITCSVSVNHTWWRPLIFHFQPHKSDQNEAYSFIFPLLVVILIICLFFFYLSIVHLVFYLIVSLTPFHTSCTLTSPFMVTLHNNSIQPALRDILLYHAHPGCGCVGWFSIYTGQLTHPISQSLVL